LSGKIGLHDLRSLQHVVRWTLGDDLAFVHHNDEISYLAHRNQIMFDEYYQLSGRA
jgi:hypothetical protein